MSKSIHKLNNLQRGLVLLAAAGVLFVLFTLAGDARTRAQEGGDPEGDEAKARIGLAISPVEMDLDGRNRALIGLGSYIVNARGACNDCHTFPNYVAGGNPFLGQPEQINTAAYLAGGRPFGAIISRNITPDPETGLPAGMTYDEFELVMRTGEDTKHLPPHVPSADNDLLQVMPWPTFRYLSERDMRAIYEYLSAIPSVP
jgi:hypothetical protein